MKTTTLSLCALVLVHFLEINEGTPGLFVSVTSPSRPIDKNVWT